ncbi:MAG: hypothetical protein ACJA2G_001693 [Cognaticolwellia sp.]
MICQQARSLVKAFGSDLKSVLRYMKAIPTGGLCLACHGSKLADDVSSKVNELYPNDQATGFKLGDIRGAFTLQKIKL